MVLNGIHISDEIIFKFLRLSELPGNQHSSIKQQEFVSRSKVSTTLPTWMHSSGIDYFDKISLVKENKNLATRPPNEIPWLAGADVAGVYPGRIDPENLIPISYNIIDDYSAAIFRDGDELRLVAMDRIEGKICWNVVFDRFEDFLVDLGV